MLIFPDAVIWANVNEASAGLTVIFAFAFRASTLPSGEVSSINTSGWYKSPVSSLTTTFVAFVAVPPIFTFENVFVLGLYVKPGSDTTVVHAGASPWLVPSRGKYDASSFDATVFICVAQAAWDAEAIKPDPLNEPVVLLIPVKLPVNEPV